MYGYFFFKEHKDFFFKSIIYPKTATAAVTEALKLSDCVSHKESIEFFLFLNKGNNFFKY